MRFAVLLFSTLVFGQVQFGLDFRGVLPQGDLEENIDDDGFGLAGRLMFDVPVAPLSAGFELGYIHFDDTRVNGRGDIDEIRTDNAAVTLDVILRLQPHRGPVRPYLEGFMGVHYFVTSTTFFYDDFDDDFVDVERDFDDAAYAIGVGAGAEFVISSWRDDDGDRSAFHCISGRVTRGDQMQNMSSPTVSNWIVSAT